MTNLPTIFRGPRPYGRNDDLPGRQRERDDGWQLVREEAFCILEGESGCGKSSLLNAALLPQAREVFHVVECRIANDPFGKLRAALLHELYRTAHEPVRAEALAEAIAQAGQAANQDHDNPSERQRPLLVCIDQCEELFITVRDAVRDRFFAVLHEAIQAGQLRLRIAIRSDFRDLLDRVCRRLDPQQQTLNLGHAYTLQAFRAPQAEAVLGDLLTPVHGQEPILKQSLDTFAGALVLDLLRPPRDRHLSQDDDKTALPVELQTVGMMLESVGTQHFSVAGLRRLGGKTGLLKAYIEDAQTYAWHKTGVPGDRALLVLRHLISPAQTKWAQTTAAIGGALGMPTEQVRQVLDAFVEKYLVNRLPAEVVPARCREHLPRSSCCALTM